MDKKHASERNAYLAAWKASGAWREDHTNFDDACREMAALSARRVNQIILQSERDKVGSTFPVEAIRIEDSALKAVEKAREKAKPEPAKNGSISADQWEKKEHYTIQDPPKPRATPTENGKPKKSLAIWAEIEGSLFGRALNRLDELNRVCPNPAMHSWLITHVKECMAKLDQWKRAA